MSRPSQASNDPSQEPQAEVGLTEPLTDTKARSANIHRDPKMMELKNFARSHGHEARLRDSAKLERRALRAQGCDEMNNKMKELSKGEAVVPYVVKSNELPASFLEKQAKEELKDNMEARLALLRRMDRFQTRLTWRSSMDRSLNRLLTNLDLSNNERLKEYDTKPAKMTDVPPKPSEEEEVEAKSKAELEEEAKAEQKKMRFAQARCNHLDKIFEWYNIHGMKEARKERKAPSYIHYNPQDPVMPGSMRVAPMMYKKPESLGQSSSSPALLAAGAAVAAAPTSSPPPELVEGP